MTPEMQHGYIPQYEYDHNGPDVCGFCNLPGADKIPHPVRWPGEQAPGSEYVHRECEEEECQRAHATLTDKEREQFLRTV